MHIAFNRVNNNGRTSQIKATDYTTSRSFRVRKSYGSDKRTYQRWLQKASKAIG
ncbi:MAG: hypothetical protein EGP82_06980 [Odoribacter splanchnicus]|nr:hypothetical protein [Odoribacter splanchnicus]